MSSYIYVKNPHGKTYVYEIVLMIRMPFTVGLVKNEVEENREEIANKNLIKNYLLVMRNLLMESTAKNILFIMKSFSK